MHNIKSILSSQPKKQKQMGMVITIVGMAGFFASMSYLGLFGATIGHSGRLMWKEIVAFGFLILGSYGLGYAFAGKQIGFWFAKWCAILLIGASILGYLLRVFK